MKLVNKNNGRTVADGRFELSKISNMEMDTNMGKDTWVMFRYFCDNLIKKKGSFEFLYMVAELTVKDSLVSIEASGLTFDDDMRAEVQLTTEEREHLFVHIINHILKKDT